MENDLNDKIKEIGSMFGIEEMPENIGEIVQSFLGKSDDSVNNTDESNENSFKYDISKKIENKDFASDDFDMSKFVKIMNKYKEAQKNRKNDKKIQLLYAIEPFLNGKRKDKVSNCVKFLTFADIAKDFKIL